MEWGVIVDEKSVIATRSTAMTTCWASSSLRRLATRPAPRAARIQVQGAAAAACFALYFCSTLVIAPTMSAPLSFLLLSPLALNSSPLFLSFFHRRRNRRF